MKQLLKVSVASCAIAFAAGGGALAQDNSGGQREMGPQDVTCARIVTLEPLQAERALYFMAGYRAAERALGAGRGGETAGVSRSQMPESGTSSQSASGQNQAAAGSAGGSGSDSQAAATPGAAPSAMGTDNQAMTGGGQMPRSGASTPSQGGQNQAALGGMSSSGTDSQAAATSDVAGTDTGTTSSTTTGSASGGTAAPGAGIAGMVAIPIEQVIVACRTTPDSRAADVMEQQNGQPAQ